MKKPYLAEALGTFGLALIVSMVASGQFVIPVVVLAGLTLALFVYTIGHISGCHINPAVTLGLLSIKKISFKDALGYIAAQFIGAFGALFVTQYFGAVLPTSLSSPLSVGIAEAIGMTFFTFGIAAVVHGKVEKTFSGVVVGGSLVVGIALAVVFGSAGVLNPAVAVALHFFTPMYLIGPIVGSVAGFNLYTWLDQQK